LGPKPVVVVGKYKYLGVYLSEHMDFKIMANSLADAGGRALGAVVNRYKTLKGLGYYTYTKLYSTCVCPILDYASEIWGLNDFPKIDVVQQRAIRVFLGVHNFAPKLALNGDCGWTYSTVRRKTAAVRFWNRLQSLGNDRITKRVFIWDKQQNTTGWASEMKSMLSEVGLELAYDSNGSISVNNAWAMFHEHECRKWVQEIPQYPKLRTYRSFKSVFCVESYVIKILSRKRRSLLAKLRMGILPLAIETGRWRSLPIDERICVLCNENQIEDEAHFMFECSFYEGHRAEFLSTIANYCQDFLSMDMCDKWKMIMSEEIVNHTCQYLEKIFEIRQNHMYVS